jgi:hypothetical protein
MTLVTNAPCILFKALDTDYLFRTTVQYCPTQQRQDEGVPAWSSAGFIGTVRLKGFLVFFCGVFLFYQSFFPWFAFAGSTWDWNPSAFPFLFWGNCLNAHVVFCADDDGGDAD